jgi:hypothetical protein
VTSNFHYRRAVQAFRLLLPEFDFRIEGSADDTFRPQAWRKTPEERQGFSSEYEKIAGIFFMRLWQGSQ